jgi:hypothetical protein
VLGKPYFRSDPGGAALLASKQEEFQAALAASGGSDLSVVVLQSTDYPELGFVEPADLLAIGPFISAQAAEEGCTRLGLAEQDCTPYQPGPPS